MNQAATTKGFLIGIGSQRAGSTLLHNVLSRSANELFMHPVKELHYFDSLFNIRQPEALKTFSRSQLQRLEGIYGSLDPAIISALPKRNQCEIRTNRILATSQVNDVEYIDLYRPCVMHHSWLGEVTPEYMLMKPEDLSLAIDRLNTRACFVLILRNPLKRFLSAFKLRHAYMRPPGKAAPGNDELLTDLKNILRSPSGWLDCQVRFNNYQESIHTFESQAGDNFLYFSLDELVLRIDSVLRRLTSLTGIDFDDNAAHEAVSARINQTDIILEMDEEAQELCEMHFHSAVESAQELVKHPLML